MRDLVPFEALSPSLAPFRDANFKLAIMAELIDTRVLDLGDFDEFGHADFWFYRSDNVREL